MAHFDRRELRQWAVRGAEQRLLDIAREAAAIYRAFPELRDHDLTGPRPLTDDDTQAVGRGAAGRRGRHMRSAAAREAARQRMLKYWAARKQVGGAGVAKTGAAPRRRGARSKLSAAGRKRISDAQKRRWAKAKSKRR